MLPVGHRPTADVVGEFELSAQAVIIASGGIGANHEMVRRYWPQRMGTPPQSMITGVPAYVDGRMLDIAADAGVRLVNRDRMWHYTEGIQNWNPIWPSHAIRILPGPSSMWFDAIGRRLPEPYLPGYDTLGTLRYLRTDPAIAGYDHSWFILTQKIIEKEFALSGSEQNPDITSKSRTAFLRERLLNRSAPGPVEAFKRHGADFVVADDLESLVAKMNALTDEPLLDPTPSEVRSGHGTCSWPTRTPKTLRCKAFAMPAATSAIGSDASQRRIVSSTPPPARSSASNCTS